MPAWAKVQSKSWDFHEATFSSDDRYLLAPGVEHSSASAVEGEWFAVPVDGGEAKPTGAGAALRAAGLRFATPGAMTGDRVLFAGRKAGNTNIWEIRLAPDTMRMRGGPRQLTFGTDSQLPGSVAAGMVALSVFKSARDLYVLPLDPDTGQPAGPLRRLTQDRRSKNLYPAGGAPGQAYFAVFDGRGDRHSDYSLNLETSARSLIAPDLDLSTNIAVSFDGLQGAYSIANGDHFTLRVGDVAAGVAQSRLLCQHCGGGEVRFSADGSYLMVPSDVRSKADEKPKGTVRLMDLASGQDHAWLEHPSDSVVSAAPFGADGQWLVLRVVSPGSKAARIMIAPWRPEPVPASEWIDAKAVPVEANYNIYGNFFLFYSGDTLMGARFDPKTRSVGDPHKLKLAADSIKASDRWYVRGPRLVVMRQEITSSVWMMKLPE